MLGYFGPAGTFTHQALLTVTDTACADVSDLWIKRRRVLKLSRRKQHLAKTDVTPALA